MAMKRLLDGVPFCLMKLAVMGNRRLSREHDALTVTFGTPTTEGSNRGTYYRTFKKFSMYVEDFYTRTISDIEHNKWRFFENS